MSRNILIFSTAYLPLIGGAEIAVKEITDRVSGFRFHLITARIRSDLPKFEKIGNVNVYRVGFGLKIDKFILPIFGLLKAVKLNRKRKYRIIWSIMASQAGVTASFFKIFFKDKKFLLTLQEGDPESHLERYAGGMRIFYSIFIKPWHILPFKFADYLTVISQYLKNRALRNGVKKPIKVIPNGVNLDVFKPRQSEFKNEKVILTVSRLVKKNGVNDLIRSAQYLNFPFKILIVGDGPDRDELLRLSKELNLDNKIEFVLKQDLDQKDLVKYYHDSDIFIRPSLSEGLGNVFLEAMASGLPIIGTEVGGIPDFLKDRETGLFCKINNPESIAEKIKEIIENEELRNSLVENGLELVREKYNWDKIALKMKKVFKKL